MKSCLCKNKISWSGIISGLIVGSVAFLATIALGAWIVSVSNLQLFATEGGVAFFIWTALSLVVSSYIAGVVAMAVVQPDHKVVTVEEDSQEIETTIHRFRKEATLTGLITGSILVLLSTYFTVNGTIGALTAATKVAGTTASVAASTVGSVVSTAGTAGLAGTAAAIAGVSQEDINAVVDGFSRQNVEKLVADNVQGLNQEQVSRIVTLIGDVFTDAKVHFQETPVTEWPAAIERQKAKFKTELTVERISERLAGSGISKADIQKAANAVEAKVNELEAQMNALVAKAQQKIEEVKVAGVEAVNTAGTYLSLAWIIYSILILGGAVLGAMSMTHTEEEHETKKHITKKPHHNR